MTYNLELEYRIDLLVSYLGKLIKKRMFGGVGYLINGNMCFGIHKEYLILRTSKEKAEELLKNETALPFDITGRPMKGWIMISPDLVETNDQLIEMLEIAVKFTETLPGK